MAGVGWLRELDSRNEELRGQTLDDPCTDWDVFDTFDTGDIWDISWILLIISRYPIELMYIEVYGTSSLRTNDSQQFTRT